MEDKYYVKTEITVTGYKPDVSLYFYDHTAGVAAYANNTGTCWYAVRLSISDISDTACTSTWMYTSGHFAHTTPGAAQRALNLPHEFRLACFDRGILDRTDVDKYDYDFLTWGDMLSNRVIVLPCRPSMGDFDHAAEAAWEEDRADEEEYYYQKWSLEERPQRGKVEAANIENSIEWDDDDDFVPGSSTLDKLTGDR